MGAKEQQAVATPPSGTYTSVPSSGVSEWGGSFTYDDATKAIVYTNATGNQFNTHNTANGNAIQFAIPDGTPPPANANHWILATPGQANGKAQYTGAMTTPNSTKAGQSGWTATQT